MSGPCPHHPFPISTASLKEAGGVAAALEHEEHKATSRKAVLFALSFFAFGVENVTRGPVRFPSSPPPHPVMQAFCSIVILQKARPPNR